MTLEVVVNSLNQRLEFTNFDQIKYQFIDEKMSQELHSYRVKYFYLFCSWFKTLRTSFNKLIQSNYTVILL